jgi:hypothetical protein
MMYCLMPVGIWYAATVFYCVKTVVPFAIIKRLSLANNCKKCSPVIVLATIGFFC